MIHKPSVNTDTGYMSAYISLVAGNDLLQALKTGLNQTIELYGSVPANLEGYRYAEGKWSIREVLSHVVDVERIFAYRALTFARKDATSLPGFDENAYVPFSNAENRSLANIIEEYRVVRQSTILLFQSLAEESLDFTGMANNRTMSARILGWMIAGHDIHHGNILQERYLV